MVPTIQRACERALSQNVSCNDIFELVKAFRKNNQDTPVVLMGYLNPIERMGYELFAKSANEVGVDAILTVDLPHEEAKEVIDIFKKYELDSIFLRLRQILKLIEFEKFQNMLPVFYTMCLSKELLGPQH